ncbi:MAG: hypothetical protein HeimC3_37100 [Candidatus Heimdallarchaeota archaeon LC_3]|nr:MAG: hypothetical protein HeimC3_37100 [Candidatus Heimdallarchaeota archaeon LC_3]
MIYTPLTIFAILIAWSGFFFKTQFPFYRTKSTFIVFIKQNSFYLIVIAWIIFIIDLLINQNILSVETFSLILLPTISAIFFRFFIFYNRYYANLIPLALITKEMEKLTSDEPEMVLIKFETENHIYPIAYLRINDIIYKKKQGKIPDYSLTFCVLCNTAHAYELPLIGEKQIEISSNNGTILNGNKILADRQGKYIWQQFTGKGLNQKTKNHPLKEIIINRGIWEKFRKEYPAGLIYKGKRPLLSRFFFNQLANIMKNNEAFSFSSGRKDKRLKRKELVVGIEINGKSKAYPIKIFESEKTELIQDKISGIPITLIHRSESTYVYEGDGFRLQDTEITKGDKKWNITGKALGNHDNLTSINIIDIAYWYMWAKFNPETEIYETKRISMDN